MQKIYKIKINNIEYEVVQDTDGKFIKPQFLLDVENEGTALKPSCEPCVLARKPLSEKSVAENVLKWGTGGINIDECRIPFEDTKNPATNPLYRDQNNYRKPSDNGQHTGETIKFTNSLNPPNTLGRFPANFCWSCNCEPNYLTGNNLFDILILCQSNNSNSNVKPAEKRNYQDDTTSEEKSLYSVVESVDTSILEKILGKMRDSISKLGIECSEEMLEENISISLNTSIYGKEQTEKYLKVLKFIISTGEKMITDLKISNAYQSRLIENLLTRVINGIQELSQVKSHSPNCEVVELFPNDNARFFYCAKASKSERNRGCEDLPVKIGYDVNPYANGTPQKNDHPTVKPQALMKYLITLITPKGGTVLDPFAGSGSTLVAAKDLGFNYIGIELTPEYIPIIEARLKDKPNLFNSEI